MAKSHIPKDDDEEKSVKENIQKRFKNMFSGSGEPLSNMSLQEVESLKARVAALEAELGEHAKRDQESTSSSEKLSQHLSVDQIDENLATQVPSEQPISGLSKIRAALTRLSPAIVTAARQFGRSRIQNRLTALILITTIPLLIGVTGFISSRAEAEIETQVNHDLQENNDALGTIVSTWLELHARTLEEIALLPDIVSMDASRQRPVLKAIAGAHPNLFLVQTTDLKGFNVARNDDAELKDYHDRAWFQGAASGRLITFEVLISRTTGKPALNMSTPIRNQSGQIVGVVSIVSELDEISKEVLETKEGHGIIYIVDPNNRVVAHPDPSYTDEELRDLSAYTPVAALREGQTGLINFIDEDGKAWRAYVSTIDNGWGIITQRPEADVLAPVRQFQRVSLILMFFGVSTMLSLAWFTIRRTLQPISLLTSTVSAIAAGDLNRVAEVKSQDEIGVLASTFNSMTAQVRDLIASLEHRVAERTHDLELASEVGRTISENVEDLSEMLTEAVEMIRARFDLYYTQIYLVDLSGKTITLRAGTGDVGKELLKRGHQLVMSTASLNGRAVVEKRSVIVADTEQSPTFLPNPLLPNTRSEISIPLIVGENVMGVLDMQSEQPGALNETNLPAFEALAGQLAVAIQNAALFTQAEEARATVEAQIRHLTEQGWQDFLDAIDRGQKFGFEFKKSQIVRLANDALSTNSKDQGLSIPITVTGTKIGEILLPIEKHQAWTPNEQELIKVTSAQLAQHIENLRLLAQAERYRAEAEQAVRRLTREGWENYQQSRADEAPGYMFDLVEVQPLSASSNGHVPAALKQPLSIHGETIGELAVEGFDHQAEATEIITAVAEQLSQHVENLRLAEETEKRSSELATVAGQLSEALDIARLANWEYDVARDRFIFNDHFYSIFHTTAQEVGGYEVSSAEYAARFVHPEDVPMVGGEIGKALASTDRHYSVHLEHRILYKDGGVGYISVDVHIERDEQGNILRYYGANQDITERKRAEMVIQESEARLSEALEIAKLANWEFDLEKDIFTFNDQFYSIFHTTADKVGGYQLSSAQYAQLFVYPDDAALVGEEIGKAIASTDRHYTKQLEHRILFADGGIGYISVDINIERNENGKITRWYGANQDITERKKAEMVIQESEARLSEALEIARLANWEYDVARDRFMFNDHFYSIFHTSAQEVGGYEISSEEYAKRFVHPDDMPIVGEEIGKALSSTDRHYNVQLEHRILYADGGVGYISVNIHIERDEQGNILRYYGANQDITERKLAEEAIAKRATELATVAQVSTTASTVLDPDQLLQAVVDLTKERFGLYHTHVYLMDESWNTLLLAAGAGEIGRKLVAEQHAIPLSLEQSLVARAARERRAVIVNDVNAEPGFLPNPLLVETCAEMAVPMIVGDKLLGIFDVQSNNPTGFSDDDANIYITLAAQVGVALQNARLYMGQAATLTQLRELDKLKSSFLANMSHELRTPLNSILGFTDVMLEELDGPLTQHMDNDLRLIQKNGQHLLHLINDVLDMAKIEAGSMNLNPETFRAQEVLEEVTSITSTLASEKNLSLYIQEDSDKDVKIYADRTRLRQVVINLVNNSIKFTDNGKVSLNIARMDGARILISVKDTGIGIPPEKLEAIFQEFTQVDSSTTRKAGGTGLGLPISRRLVEMHGGRLWAESTGIPGEGSTFFVELPTEARISEVVEKQAN